MSFMFIVYLVVAAAIAYAVVLHQNKQMEARKTEYFAKYPDASKIYLAAKNYFIIYDGVQLVTANNEAPVVFRENLFTKNGFYLKPGKNTVWVGYSYTRPGIMHKTVTTTYEPVKREFTVEPNKTYKLCFDRKAEEFKLEEMK